jgi:hypothetical protein
LSVTTSPIEQGGSTDLANLVTVCRTHREWFAARRRHAEGREGKLSFRDRVRELLTPVEKEAIGVGDEGPGASPTSESGGPGPAGAPA